MEHYWRKPSNYIKLCPLYLHGIQIAALRMTQKSLCTAQKISCSYCPQGILTVTVLLPTSRLLPSHLKWTFISVFENKKTFLISRLHFINLSASSFNLSVSEGYWSKAMLIYQPIKTSCFLQDTCVLSLSTLNMISPFGFVFLEYNCMCHSNI